MKILFIDPPFEDQDRERGNFQAVLNIIPSLGMAYIAAVAEGAGHEVRIEDAGRGLPWGHVEGVVRSFSPDLVGFNATSQTYQSAEKGAALCKRLLPGCLCVLGGAHPTAMPEHAAATGLFDVLVLGEGEATFLELLGYLEGKGPTSLGDIQGIAFLENGALRITPPRPHIADLDGLPFPARHLLPPLSAYSPTPASYRKLPLAHIITSRGCPAKCNFCDRSVFGESFRGRSAENVMAEVEEVIGRYGAKEIRFFDDTFTLNRKRVIAICEAMRRLRRRIPWTCLTRVNMVSPELLRLMKAAGCWQVLYGLESGDAAVLASVNKGTTIEQNRQAVLWAHKAGLRVRGDFIVGTPDETLESLEKTLAFACSLPLDFAHFNEFIPFPGTEFYRRLEAMGYRFDYLDRSKRVGEGDVQYVPPGLSEEAYKAFVEHAYKRFYMRPSYLLRKALSMRSWTQLRGHIRGFFSMAQVS